MAPVFFFILRYWRKLLDISALLFGKVQVLEINFELNTWCTGLVLPKIIGTRKLECANACPCFKVFKKKMKNFFSLSGL